MTRNSIERCQAIQSNAKFDIMQKGKSITTATALENHQITASCILAINKEDAPTFVGSSPG